MTSRAALLLATLLAPAPALARPVVLELFTSQACSSCPPADALLTRYAHASQEDTLPLAFHVTYWDGLAWRDPFSSPRATARQRRYAAVLGTETFTPQLVIDGLRSVIGSDEDAAAQAIAEARAAQRPGPALSVRRQGADSLAISVGAGHGAARLILAGYDPAHDTQVRGGENGGLSLHESNIVRGFAELAPWRGAPLSLTAPLPAGAQCAVLLQEDDGTILAASRCESAVTHTPSRTAPPSATAPG